MPRSQRNDNFIDKTFTVLADILLKVLPTSQREKQAFTYYRDGMSAQAEGEYAEYCIKGANDAVEYYNEVGGNYEKLKLSFEWAWLQERFNKL